VNEHEHEHETHMHLPAPSVWPFVMGAGTTLAAFGIATSLAFCAVGLVLLFWGVIGWIRELRHA
jgi:cytochrome c oxidase subunit 1